MSQKPLIVLISFNKSVSFHDFYLFWKYALSDGEHEVEIRLTNPSDKANVFLDTVIVYGAEPNLIN